MSKALAGNRVVDFKDAAQLFRGAVMPKEIYLSEDASEKERARVDAACTGLKVMLQMHMNGWAEEDGAEEPEEPHCDTAATAIADVAVEVLKLAGMGRDQILDAIGRVYDHQK